MSELSDLKEKIRIQNDKIDKITQEEKSEQTILSDELSKEIQKFKECLSRVQKINPINSSNPLAIGFDAKIQEFSRLIDQNKEKIKKNNESVPELLRKKKENDEFSKNSLEKKKCG